MFQQYAAILQDVNIIAWIVNNGIRTERGVPISFKDHAFMIDPYLDWNPNQGVRKASQCGWSVMTNLKLFWAARYGIPEYGISAANVIYTLPSDQDVNTFVPSKTNLLIKNNPVISDYMRDSRGEKLEKKDVDSIQRKKIGDSMVYFKGTRSKTAALMLTSDLNIHDESDRSEKFIIDEYESRLANSSYKGRWIFSNPSAPHMPADMMYLNSDQKHWFIKCEHCGYWQYLDWIKLSEHTFTSGTNHCFIDDTNKLYVCGKCTRPLSNDNRRRGKWVKKYKSKAISGYWVTHLMYPNISVKDLLNTEENKSKSYFMNFVLGLPYVGSDVRVDGQTIVQNIVLDVPQWTRGKVAMGVDNGDIKHYVIGDETGIFQAGKTKSWSDIEYLIQKYDATTVIDLNPYPNKPRELSQKYLPQGKHQWRVYCSFYIEQSKNFELIDWGSRDKRNMVYPVREPLFDELVDYISSGNWKFYGSKSHWEEYIEQWETMYRGDFVGTRKAQEVSNNEPHQQARGVWLSSNGNGHFAHATLYFYVALSKIIAGGGKIMPRENTIEKVKQALGGVPRSTSVIQQNTPQELIVPETIIQQEMPQIKKAIPDLSDYVKVNKKSGSLSDSIK